LWVPRTTAPRFQQPTGRDATRSSRRSVHWAIRSSRRAPRSTSGCRFRRASPARSSSPASCWSAPAWWWHPALGSASPARATSVWPYATPRNGCARPARAWPRPACATELHFSRLPASAHAHPVGFGDRPAPRGAEVETGRLRHLLACDAQDAVDLLLHRGVLAAVDLLVCQLDHARGDALVVHDHDALELAAGRGHLLLARPFLAQPTQLLARAVQRLASAF